jgi:oligopeptidase A
VHALPAFPFIVAHPRLLLTCAALVVFLCSYYSYKWAEVLSADAFAAFEEAGLENESAVAEIGRRFASTVLALGGGRAPELVFQDFRGRNPSVEPLLRHSNLVATA